MCCPESQTVIHHYSPFTQCIRCLFNLPKYYQRSKYLLLKFCRTFSNVGCWEFSPDCPFHQTRPAGEDWSKFALNTFKKSWFSNYWKVFYSHVLAAINRSKEILQKIENKSGTWGELMKVWKTMSNGRI